MPLSTDAEIPLPELPRLAGDITESYIRQLVATLEDTVEILNSERIRRFPEIALTGLQAGGSGLRVGDVFQVGGTLKIVRAGDAFAGSLVGTTSLGSVTIVTT